MAAVEAHAAALAEGAEWLASQSVENHQTPQRKLDPAELRKRRDAITYGRASVELEGFKLPAEYLAAADRFAAGEITFGELGEVADELARQIKAQQS
ncbi:antitoxin VbhA family protein (plasmid) [Xanthomonas sp. CPBF 426]|nr:antitoxin VbhA family protein [Xanthomonas sp. CPBF 426]